MRAHEIEERGRVIIYKAPTVRMPNSVVMTIGTKFRSLLKAHAPFLILLAVAFALYATVAWFQWCNMDEGAYLDAARTVVHGGQPFVTFAAREPGVIYYLAMGVLIFGPQLFVARMQMVIIDLLTATAVYLLARDLKSPLAGLAAAGILLFNPYSVFSGTIILLEPMAAMPLAWMAYLLLRRVPPDSFRIPLIIGLLFGAADLFRRDIVLLLPFVVVVLWWRMAPASTKARLKSTAIFVLGLAIPLGIVIGYFAAVTSPSWMWTEYGLGAAYFENVVPLNLHYGTLYYLIVYEPVVIIPAIVALAGVVWAKRGSLAGFSVLAVLTLIVAYVLMAGPANFDWGQGELYFSDQNILPMIVATFWLVLVVDLLMSHRHGLALPWRVWGFTGGWVMVFLVFYTFVYPQFFTNYFGDISVPLSILVGIWWADRIEEHSTGLKAIAAPRTVPIPLGRQAHRWVQVSFPIIIAGFMVGMSFFSAVVVLGPSNPYMQPLAYNDPQTAFSERTYSPDLVNQVASYLDAHSPANATLFSGDDIFIAAANRANLMDLSIIIDQMAYVSYPNNVTAYPSDPFGLAPSMDQMLSKWNTTWVPLVVVGQRQAEMDVLHPVVGWYINTNYHEIAAFGNGLESNYVTVWARGPSTVTAAKQVASYDVGNYTTSVAVDPSNGTVVSGELDSSVINAISPSGHHWTFSLPAGIGGVRSLAFDLASSSLWVASNETDVVHFSFISGTQPQALQVRVVGYAPDSLAFDDQRNLVFVSSEAFSNVTELNSTTGVYEGSYAILTDPLAIQVDPSIAELFEASAGTDSLAIYNETSGTQISDIQLDVQPNNLLITPVYYIVTSWNPGELVGVYRSNGQVAYTVPSGLGSVGLVVNGTVVSVASQLDSEISFFNLTSGYPMGSIQMSSCPAELALSLEGNLLYEAGPCSSPLVAWKLSQPITWSVAAIQGSTVLVNGVEVTPGITWYVFPSVYDVVVDSPGYEPYETTVWVSGSSILTAPLGISLAYVSSYQASFTAMMGAGAVIATITCGMLVPLYLRRRLS
jgi:4-amino-4-deoxy-L-arabinose transferase-like glycosyltransferase